MRPAARVLLALIVLLAGCSGPGQEARWTEIFRDDFSGAAGSPLPSGWLHDLGTCYPGCPAPRWGTGEIETMTDSTENVSLDGAGNLAITPLLREGAWTSGRVETTRSDFRPPPGGVLRVEARIQLPAVTPSDGAGYWPAFWMLGAPLRDGYTGWPAIGEIDVVEAVNGRPSVMAAMHCGVMPGGPCGEPSGIGSGERPCPTCHGSFHRYAVEISEKEVRWYLDDAPVLTVAATRMDQQTWRRATAHGFFLILNVAIGGGLPEALGGGPTPTTIPGRPMLIDYVSVRTRLAPR
ncbi:glycoside hydrolase family 16 protein [Streptosporangium saharense]|uniref:glycoside hydrolase family 16 protein n=1 Tax=Streptosporangium saharense TaxID=1706840 RepID=UPI0036C90E0C